MARTNKKLCYHRKEELIELGRTVELLYERVGDIDEISIEGDGSVILRREIYFRKPNGTEWFRHLIRDRLDKLQIPCEILSTGECWRPFKESKTPKERSHWYARIVIDPTFTIDRLIST